MNTLYLKAIHFPAMKQRLKIFDVLSLNGGLFTEFKFNVRNKIIADLSLLPSKIDGLMIYFTVMSNSLILC